MAFPAFPFPAVRKSATDPRMFTALPAFHRPLWPDFFPVRPIGTTHVSKNVCDEQFFLIVIDSRRRMVRVDLGWLEKNGLAELFNDDTTLLRLFFPSATDDAWDFWAAEEALLYACQCLGQVYFE
jgi:hypothetical protein